MLLDKACQWHCYHSPCLHLQALGLQEPQAKTVATNKKRSAADAAPAAPNSAPPAAKRTRGSLPEAAAAAAGSKTPGPGVASGTGNNAVGERGGRAGPAQRAAAGASAGHGARASHIPVSPSEGAAGNPASTSTGSGKTRGPLGRFLPRVEGATTSGAGAARSGAAAGSGHAAVKQGAGNQQVLDNVDDAVKLVSASTVPHAAAGLHSYIISDWQMSAGLIRRSWS